MKFLAAFISIYFIETTLSAEILCIFPRAAYSHQTVYRAVTEKLIENGHKITLMSTHPSEGERNHQNVTLIDLSFSVEIFQKTLDVLFESKSFVKAFYNMIDSEVKLVNLQLSSGPVQQLLNDPQAKYDLLLIEANGMSPFHAFADHFNIPVVAISSADAFTFAHEIMGNEINPVAHPDRVLPFEIAETFWQRIVSCVFNLFMKFSCNVRAAEKYEPIMKKYFPKVKKSHHELLTNVDLQLINAHPALGFIRPILPNTIQLGFLHIKPPKELPIELEEIMDKSAQGIIYMSFGTIVTSKLLAERNFHAFLKTFSELPYEVLWKHEGKSPFMIPANVHVRKWFPQSDLLAHPNVKLFITHGVTLKDF